MLLSLDENRQNVIEAVAARALAFTVQLLVRSQNRSHELVPFGSGVFIRRKEKFVLLTAGHCIREKVKIYPIGINRSKTFHLLRGRSWVHSDDELDIGFVVLSKESADFCQSNFPFLEERQIDYRHILNDNDHYLVAGYPVSRTDVNLAKRVIRTEPFVLETRPKPPSFHLSNGFDPQRLLAFSFHRRMSQYYGEEHFHKSPDPTGISGSGLWSIPSLVTADPTTAPYFLTAIMTEYHDTQSYFKATHIRQALDVVDPILDNCSFDIDL